MVFASIDEDIFFVIIKKLIINYPNILNILRLGLCNKYFYSLVKFYLNKYTYCIDWKIDPEDDRRSIKYSYLLNIRKLDPKNIRYSRPYRKLTLVFHQQELLSDKVIIPLTWNIKIDKFRILIHNPQAFKYRLILIPKEKGIEMRTNKSFDNYVKNKHILKPLTLNYLSKEDEVYYYPDQTEWTDLDNELISIYNYRKKIKNTFKPIREGSKVYIINESTMIKYDILIQLKDLNGVVVNKYIECPRNELFEAKAINHGNWIKKTITKKNKPKSIIIGLVNNEKITNENEYYNNGSKPIPAIVCSNCEEIQILPKNKKCIKCNFNLIISHVDFNY